MKLAYKIARKEPIFCVEDDTEYLEPRIAKMLLGKARGEKDKISSLTKICLDNVAKFVAEAPREEWNINRDFANMAPPFGEFFVEWVGPDELQNGFFVKAFDLQLERPDSNLFEFVKNAKDFHGVDTSQAKWILDCSLWCSSDHDRARRPLAACGSIAPIVSNDGSFICASFTGCLGYQEDNALVAESLLPILAAGLSFFHCKNIAKKQEREPLTQKWHSENKCKVFKYHTLNLNPLKINRERNQNQASIGSSGTKKALHVCRGHFSKYTAEKPLFGKHVGTFFIPDHARGSLEKGRVVKDYSVAVPAESSQP